VARGKTSGTLDIGLFRASRFAVETGSGSAECCTIHSVGVDFLRSSALSVGHDIAIWSAVFGGVGLFGQFVSYMSCVDGIDTCCHEKVLLLLDLASVVQVLTWVGSLVFQDLDKLVETSCDDGAKDRSEPVDPVVARKLVVDNSRTEGTSWIQGATSKVHTSQLCNEEGKTNACCIVSAVIGTNSDHIVTYQQEQ